MTDVRPEPSPLARKVAELLATYLGPHTAKVAVKTFAQRSLGRGPETLGPGDLDALLAALRPMLRAFVGRERSETVLASIRAEVMA